MPKRVQVRAGSVDRITPLVRVQVSPERLGLPRRVDASVGLTLRDNDTNTAVAGQYEPRSGELAFVLPGELAAGAQQTLVVEPGEPDPRFATSCDVKLDRVVLGVGDERFADYIVAGTRRPYFWPVVGPAGASVVRGQGSGDHPHHTGMSVNYGGHSEGGSVNIWSDWDEPPYGPGGRMIHRGVRRSVTGPVYGELVHDLSYVDTDGELFATEVRTVRWWWASHERRFLDVESQLLEIRDAGPKPFLFMIRTPDSFGIPEHGRVLSSTGGPITEKTIYRASWVDASGPTGGPPPSPPEGPPEDLPDLRERAQTYAAAGSGPWNGIALLDHPANDGYPNVVGKYARPQQIVQAHYPPEDAPEGPFTFRQRVLVHAGDTESAGVAGYADDYAHPLDVAVDDQG